MSQAVIQAPSLTAQPIADVFLEAQAFVEQMAEETGQPVCTAARLDEIRSMIETTGSYSQSFDEMAFGARVAWRNSIRCIGRMFWHTLSVFDGRDALTYDDIFGRIVHHLKWSTNGGRLRPAITVFRAGEPRIRILNPQLILYAGYELNDGTVLGDPKNLHLTRLAESLGWRSRKTEFDILPLLIQIGTDRPRLFELPDNSVLEVPISHPENGRMRELGLRWFALPAVSGMTLDVGGIQYTAAPSTGIYMGTEIGCFNLGDPVRYNKLPIVAKSLGIDASPKNPLWRDQALVELNRAVLHSFKEMNVSVMDHHALSKSFMKFKNKEENSGRNLHGDWSWLVPPLSSNLSWIWHDTSISQTIIKPNYFYPASGLDASPPQATRRCPFF